MIEWLHQSGEAASGAFLAVVVALQWLHGVTVVKAGNVVLSIMPTLEESAKVGRQSCLLPLEHATQPLKQPPVSWE